MTQEVRQPCGPGARAGAALLVAALAACSGGGSKSSSTAPPPPTLDAAGRTALFQAVDTELTALDGLPATTREARTVAWLQGRPEVTASGGSGDGDVWADLVDGTTMILADDLADPDPAAMPPQSVAAGPLPLVPGSLTPALTTAPGLGIPDQLNAFAGTSLGPIFVAAITNFIKPALELRNYLFSDNPTVDRLKALDAVGALYLNVHGATYLHHGQPAYTINTATQRATDGSTDAAYAADLADGSLTFFRAKAWFPGGPTGITTVWVWTYAITPQFVRKYWTGKFARGAFVFINGCSGASAAAGDFSAAVLAAGASTYAAWTERVASDEAVNTGTYLFDRLLGKNAYLPEVPPQRAFPYLALEGDMHTRLRSGKTYGFDVSQAPPDPHASPPPPPPPPASLQFTTLDFAFGVLSPSIQSLVVDEPNQQLQLAGVFGDAAGDVFVGGTKVPVSSWLPGLVIVNLPTSGAQAAGPVRVAVPSGQDSNDVPLSGWTGRATFTGEDNGLVATMSFLLHFRADVHGYRVQPGQPPIYPPESFQQAADSTWSYDFSGTYTSPDGSFTETWSGSGTMPAASNPGVVASGLAFQGLFDTATSTWKMTMNAVALNGRHVHTVQHVAGAPDIVSDYDETVGGVPAFSDGTSFTAPYDAAFNIGGATRTEAVPSGVGGPAPASMTLTWEPMVPLSAPGQTSTERRRGPTRRPRKRRVC